MCLHLVGLLTIYILPNILHTGSRNKSKEKRSRNVDTDNKNGHHSSTSTFISKNSMSDISKDIAINGHEHHFRKTNTNYLLKDFISKEVNKIKGETDNLSNILKGKIEAANIDGLIDKTFCGIVELKVFIQNR